MWAHVVVCAAETWRKIRPLSTTPSPRAGHVLVAHRKRIHLYGGIGSSGVLGDFWSFDPGECAWGQRNIQGSPAPASRSHHSGVLNGDHLYVYGGSGTEVPGTVWDLDMAQKRWSLAFKPADDGDETSVSSGTIHGRPGNHDMP